MIFGSILIFFVTLFVFWIIEKVLHSIAFWQDRKAAKARELLIEAETRAKTEAAQYYRARTWEVLKNNQHTGRFTTDEIRAIKKMGLGEYLEEGE